MVERSQRERRYLSKVVVAGMLAVGAAVAASATAAADPGDPPAPADPGPGLPGLPGFGGLPLPPGTPLGNVSSTELLLGQYPVPSVPGGQPASPPGDSTLSAMAPLNPINFYLPGQGDQSMYSVSPADPNAPPPTKWDYFRGAHGLWHTVMGRMTDDQLGEPLPGTAPPPGTNMPQGENW
jgi:hypothetical protein